MVFTGSLCCQILLDDKNIPVTMTITNNIVLLSLELDGKLIIYSKHAIHINRQIIHLRIFSSQSIKPHGILGDVGKGKTF